MKLKGIVKILAVILLISLGGFIIFFLLTARFRDGHGGVYQEVRQCGNVRGYMYFLEEYHKNEGTYPDSLPQADSFSKTLTINGHDYSLFGMRQLNYKNLNTYSYKKIGDGFELKFFAPNGKEFTISDTKFGLELCKSGAKIKCLENDYICNWWYFKR